MSESEGFSIENFVFVRSMFPGEHQSVAKGWRILLLSTCFSVFHKPQHVNKNFPKRKRNHAAVNGGIIRFTLFSGDFAEKWMTTDNEKVTMGWSGLCTNNVTVRVTWPSLSSVMLVSQWTIMSSPILCQDLISIQLWDCSAETLKIEQWARSQYKNHVFLLCLLIR